MINNKKVLAIIPARGESKGLPQKNSKTLAEKPLIAWTIEAALESQYVDRTIVSTDSEEIMGIAGQWGAETPFKRPTQLSTDSSTLADVAVHALEWIAGHENKTYDILILLQPTSPLRNTKHIDSALKKFTADENAERLVSIVKVEKSPFWMKKINQNGYLESLILSKEGGDQVRRQELPAVYLPNGAIYVAPCSDFQKTKNFYSKNGLAYLLMEKEASLDIDDQFDFDLAESILKKYSTKHDS